MASESVPYLARLRPLITAKLALWDLMTGKNAIPNLDRIWPSYSSDIEAIDSINNKLSLEQRMLLVLRYQEGLSWDKIALELGVGRRIVYEMHSAILTVFAYEFGLL